MTKWQQLKLGEIATFVNGYAFKPSDWNDTGIPIIRIQNLTNDNANRNYYNGQLDEKYRVVRGDILISWSATIGVFEWTREDSYLNQHIFKVVFNKLKVNKSFFKYLIKQKINEMLAKVHGSTMKHITKSNFDNIPILLPDINEQDRIARILDKAEEIRTKKKLANEKLDEFLKSTFIDMFGNPVINSKQLPKVKLSDMGTLARGKSKHRPRNAPELLNGPYPLIQTGDVANSGLYLKTYNQTYSEMGLKQSKMWKAGTLCITIAANIAKTSILTFDACFPDSIVGFTNSDKCSIHYIQFWLMFLQAVLEAEAPQSAQKNINLEILNSLELPYPPIEQQNQFAQIVQKVEAQKEKNQKVIEQMDNLFNSLMQQAFNSSL
ncbi:TPA: restriction endonuclease subunit S [Candidatus Galligastranaerophilus faecipullorum]|nr:restriction endonuclease subunit S [Candidatus Galligastranaerophilus faecipullorum]